LQRALSLDAQANQWSIYASVGGTTLAEYTEFSPSNPTWVKSYTYLGDSQLSTITPNGTGGEYTEYNHPDRLGTRVITNQTGGTSYEQAHLPFGTALNAESSVTNNNKRFTSYDRSSKTGLDYAINRTYDSKQGRFTQVDPIGMTAFDLKNPQTLNLYSYCGNDPVNHVDPDGLFWGAIKKLFKWIGKALKFIMVAASIALAVITIILMPATAALWFKILTIVGSVASAASSVLNAAGLTTAANILGIVAAAASFGLSFYNKAGELLSQIHGWTKKAIFKAVSAGATLASRVLGALGHATASRVLSLGATITGFISDGYKDDNKNPKPPGYKGWARNKIQWFKFLRASAEQVAGLVGANRVASYLGLAGIVEDGYDLYGLFKNKLPANPFKAADDDVFGKISQGVLGVPFEKVWKASMIVGRVYQGAAIANRSFLRIDRVVSVR